MVIQATGGQERREADSKERVSFEPLNRELYRPRRFKRTKGVAAMNGMSHDPKNGPGNKPQAQETATDTGLGALAAPSASADVDRLFLQTETQSVLENAVGGSVVVAAPENSGYRSVIIASTSPGAEDFNFSIDVNMADRPVVRTYAGYSTSSTLPEAVSEAGYEGGDVSPAVKSSADYIREVLQPDQPAAATYAESAQVHRDRVYRGADPRLQVVHSGDFATAA